MARTSYISMR